MTHTVDMCEECRQAKACVKCASCDMLLCEACAHLELLGSGCGTVYPLYYCGKCVFDEQRNPNAGLKEREWS